MIEQYTIDLPGKSLYDINFNIQIRKVTPLEVKYADSLFRKQQMDPDEYIEFIKKLISFDNPEMTFEKLFWFDCQYVLYQIRHRTFPNHPIRLYFKCTNKDCEKKDFSQELDIGALEIFEPSDIEGFTNKIKLDNLGEVSIRNKTIGDDKDIFNFAKKNNIDLTDVSNVLFLAELSAISKEYSLEELYKFAEDGTLTAEDMIKIEDWISKSIWGVKEETMTKCPFCGKEEPRSYTLTIGDYFSVDRHQ